MKENEFEIEIGAKLYQGTYEYIDNKLFIHECKRWTCDERNIETTTDIDSLNDKEEFQKVYEALEKDTADERMSEEEYKNELRYSIAEEKADEGRKYFTGVKRMPIAVERELE